MQIILAAFAIPFCIGKKTKKRRKFWKKLLIWAKMMLHKSLEKGKYEEMRFNGLQ